QVSISASATAGSAAEPGCATAPVMRWAASLAASASRPLTTTPAPCAASGSLIALALLAELHDVHVPVAAQVGEQAVVVDAVGEDATHRAGDAVVEPAAQHQDVGYLCRRAGREGLLAGDPQVVCGDVRVV